MNIPDFAFPKEIEATSKKNIEIALKKGDGCMALRNVIDNIIAHNLISKDELTENLSLIDSVIPELNQTYVSLAYLLKANLLKQYYESSKYRIDNLTLTSQEESDIPDEWTTETFYSKIRKNIEEGLNNKEVLVDLSLDKISLLLDPHKLIDLKNLTIYDFYLLNAAKQLEPFCKDTGFETIPFYPTEEKENFITECKRFRKNLIEKEISLNEEKDAGEAIALGAIALSSLKERGEGYDIIEKYIKQLQGKEAEAILLFYLYDNYSYKIRDEKEFYSLLKVYSETFPDSRFTKIINGIIRKIGEKEMTLKTENLYYPETEVKASAILRNMQKGYVLLYKLSDDVISDRENFSIDLKRFPGRSRLIDALKVECEREIPFSEEVDFMLPAMTPGSYVVIPSKTPKLEDNWRETTEKWSLQPFRVTRLSMVALQNNRDGETRLFVTDAMNQRPLAKIPVKFIQDTWKNKKIISSVTDAQGCVSVPEGYYTAIAKVGENMAVLRVNNYKNNQEPIKNYRTTIFTELSIYRPGDKIRFEVIAWWQDGEKRGIMSETPIKVALRDPSYDVVDTLSLITDKTGRIWGEFKAPTEGLLGNHSITVEKEKIISRNDNKDIENKTEIIGRTNIQVADYKTPTFKVELENLEERNFTLGDTVKINGEAKAFSGPGIAGAQVKYEVSYMNRERWWSREKATFSGTAITGANGNFNIDLPTENLKDTPYSEGLYTVRVTVTIPSGESEEAPLYRFALGEHYKIEAEIPEKICLEKDTLEFEVKVLDQLGLEVRKELNYVLNNATGSSVLSGRFESPELKIPCKNLKAGEYELCFTLPEDSLTYKSKLILYLADDTVPPVKTQLWLPETNIEMKSGQTIAEVTVGSSYKGSVILYAVNSSEGITGTGWLECNGENNILKITSDEDLYVTFSGMHDFKSKVESVKITAAKKNEELVVTAESFRDKTTAGEKEKWIFRFRKGEEHAALINCLAVMTDKALNSLYPFRWTYPQFAGRFGPVYLDRNYINNSLITGRFPDSKEGIAHEYLWANNLVNWQTYGFPLAGSFGGMRKLLFSATTDEVPTGRVVGSSLSMKRAAVINDAEMSVETDGIAEEASFGGENDIQEAEQDLRPIELPVAFFMPDLQTDEKGDLVVEFEVPDFNTTWQFQLLGYDEKLDFAYLINDVLTSKPIMVKGNYPVFLRTSDKAQIAAMIYNNNEEERIVKGNIIVSDPSDGRVISEKIIEEIVMAPNESRPIDLTFEVPSNLDMLEIKVIAGDLKFSDGEKTVIPVYPSSAPVISSEVFYFTENQKELKLKIAKDKENANLTLKYTSNALGECLLALPSIAETDSKSSIQLSRTLYALATGHNIVNGNIIVRNNLEKLKQEGCFDNKISNLYADEELKIVGLKATPWVNNAERETKNLQSLAQYLDVDATETHIRQIVEELRRLQTDEGGWSWFEGMKPSEYLTLTVLENIARIENKSCLPNEINGMVKRALAYCDSIVSERYKENNKLSVNEILNYLYVRSFYPDIEKSETISRITTLYSDKLTNEWKDFSIGGKAKAAIVLARNKKYINESRDILNSISQFTKSDPQRGVWFDNIPSWFGGRGRLLTTAIVLDAFYEIENDSPVTKGLLQWLVLSKETEEWNDEIMVPVIQTIVKCSPKWMPADDVRILSGEKEISIPVADRVTGSITLSLNSEDLQKGREIMILKENNSPAWGGIIRQEVLPIKTVKAEENFNLKISKKLIVMDGSSRGEEISERELKPGDRIQVSVTIEVGKDMEYVTLTDERSACLEPIEWISGFGVTDGLWCYRETRDTRTSFFFDFLPKGTHIITYDCYLSREGEYSSGIATVQCLYSPIETAHSAGSLIDCH